MTLVSKIDLSNADRIFATANTPLYLVRNLQSDRAVRMIARQVPAQEILNELASALKTEAVDFRSSVYPYVLLVALSLNTRNRFLTKATTYPAPHHRWYAYCADYLAKNFKATSMTELQQGRAELVVQQPQSSTSSMDADSRVNALVIGGN